MSRSRVVLAGAVGIVALAGGALWALGNSGTESSTDTSATPPEPVFPCVTAITSEARPSRYGRVVLDAALMPPKRLRGRPAREPGSRFPYWMKQGIQIAAEAPPVEIALPLAWRSQAGIHWGDRRVANRPPLPGREVLTGAQSYGPARGCTETARYRPQ